MLKEEQIKKDLKKIEEFILFDCERKDLGIFYIGLLNYTDYSRADIIRHLLKHILEEP